MDPGGVRALGRRAWKVVRVNWHLGVTAFGGPPVHFQIVSFMLAVLNPDVP